MRKQTKTTNKSTTISLMLGALVFAGIVTVTADAEARRGRRGHKQKAKMGYCGGVLKHGVQGAMKAQLKLSERQIQRIDAVRNNFLSKRIDLRARMARLRLRHKQLMQQDQPPQDRVLKMMRQRRHLRGMLAEERVKAQLKVRATLTPQQRKQLRETIAKRKARRGKFGKDRMHNRRGWKHKNFSRTTRTIHKPVKVKRVKRVKQAKRVKRIKVKRVKAKRVKRYSARARVRVSL